MNSVERIIYLFTRKQRKEKKRFIDTAAHCITHRSKSERKKKGEEKKYCLGFFYPFM